MAGKKHPILTVLVILVAVALVLGGTMVAALKILAPSSPLFFHEKIGIVTIDGAILDSRAVTSQLVKFRKDKRIKAVVLRINSPGGSIGPTQEIYREVQKMLPHKQVVASMGAVGASGGYYIASAAHKIVANPGTITGSIGVLMEFVRVEELLKKIGVDLEILKSGEFKDIGSPDRKLTDRDREILHRLIKDLQKQFVEAVAMGRNISVEKVDQMADGRVFSGARAKALGLVDELGNFQDTVELAKEMAGIQGEATLVRGEGKKSALWDLVLRSGARWFLSQINEAAETIQYRWNGFVPQDIT
ncbi:MAG: signal peptide peptidase SppA, partial [Thermodesulfobacteriota bacterium]